MTYKSSLLMRYFSPVSVGRNRRFSTRMFTDCDQQILMNNPQAFLEVVKNLKERTLKRLNDDIFFVETILSLSDSELEELGNGTDSWRE